MKSLKKSVIAVLVIGTLSVAGTAFAYRGQGNGQAGPAGYFGGHHQMIRQQWNGNNLPPAPWAGNGNTCCCGQTAPSQGLGHMGSPRQGRGFAPAFGNPGWQGSRGGHFGQRGQFFTEVPQEIRDKEAEAAKLRIDLGNVLSHKPLNREKAAELDGQINKLRQDVRTWRFEQKLNRIEEFNKKAAEDAKAGQDK